MKKSTVLAVVLIIIFPSHLFSETPHCQQSFELGKTGAKEEHKILGWYFLGFASGLLAYGTLVFLDSGVESGLADGLATSIFIAPYIPAIAFPTRNNITPYSSGGNLECYRDGYRRRAVFKNCGAVFMGELTSHAVAFMVGIFVAPFLLAGGL
jgi:hypothetical protein